MGNSGEKIKLKLGMTNAQVLCAWQTGFFYRFNAQILQRQLNFCLLNLIVRYGRYRIYPTYFDSGTVTVALVGYGTGNNGFNIPAPYRICFRLIKLTN